MNELKARIEELVKIADAKSERYYHQMGYTFGKPTRHRADFISDKWCRIINLEERGGQWVSGSVYAFVALQDGYTKSLGLIRVGDIHKPASFKTPAKHARGNVFEQDFAKYLTEHGPYYMK